MNRRQSGYLHPLTKYHRQLREAARLIVRRALARSGQNHTHAARALGVQRTYLYSLMRDLEIKS